MLEKDLEKKALERYWRSSACGSLSSKRCYILGFTDGASLIQEEIVTLEQQIEQMKCCGNCKFQDVHGDCVLESPYYCGKIYENCPIRWELKE